MESNNKITNYYVHESSYIDEDVIIGSYTKIWHFCHIQKGARIGNNCSFGQNVYVGNNVKIGNYVKIQNNVSVYTGVELEDHVFCGPSMVFTNDINPRSEFPKHGNYIKTLVKESATLGANATIVCGNIIGRYAMIAAGAVITSNVPDYALMMGIPAKQAGWICECGERLKSESNFHCTKCGLTYALQDNLLYRTD